MDAQGLMTTPVTGRYLKNLSNGIHNLCCAYSTQRGGRFFRLKFQEFFLSMEAPGEFILLALLLLLGRLRISLINYPDFDEALLSRYR